MPPEDPALDRQRELELKFARTRHAWALTQIELGRITPALVKFEEESRLELEELVKAQARYEGRNPPTKPDL